MSDNDKSEFDNPSSEDVRQTSKGKGTLGYKLDILNDCVTFQLNYQSPSVVNFLRSREDGMYMVGNGYMFRLGALRPEWRFSTHTIYLNGTTDSQFKHIDIVRFPPKLENQQANVYIKRSVEQFHVAMKQFSDAVEEWEKANYISTKVPKDRLSGKFVV